MANFSLCPHIIGDVGDFTGDSFIRSPILSTRMLNFRGRTANVQIKHPPSCWGCKPSLFLATQFILFTFFSFFWATVKESPCSLWICIWLELLIQLLPMSYWGIWEHLNHAHTMYKLGLIQSQLCLSTWCPIIFCFDPSMMVHEVDPFQRANSRWNNNPFAFGFLTLICLGLDITPIFWWARSWNSLLCLLSDFLLLPCHLLLEKEMEFFLLSRVHSSSRL